MDRETLIGLLEVFVQQGLPLENYLRDVKIRNDFFSTIDEDPKVNRTKLKQKLADKYCLGYKNIEGIVYARRKSETPVGPKAGELQSESHQRETV